MEVGSEIGVEVEVDGDVEIRSETEIDVELGSEMVEVMVEMEIDVGVVKELRVEVGKEEGKEVGDEVNKSCAKVDPSSTPTHTSRGEERIACRSPRATRGLGTKSGGKMSEGAAVQGCRLWVCGSAAGGGSITGDSRQVFIAGQLRREFVCNNEELFLRRPGNGKTVRERIIDDGWETNKQQPAADPSPFMLAGQPSATMKGVHEVGDACFATVDGPTGGVLRRCTEHESRLRAKGLRNADAYGVWRCLLHKEHGVHARPATQENAKGKRGIEIKDEEEGEEEAVRWR